MVFSSTIFIFIFLPVTLAGYYLLRGRNIRNVFLLIMSLVFYAWGEPGFILILLSSILINYCFAIGIDRYRDRSGIARFFLIADVIVNLGILFVFKYLGFALSNINMIIGDRIKVPDIALPIGISFFTFQALSYVLDVYADSAKVQKNLFNLALYVAFFPQLIAGPIVRYNSIEEQLMMRQENTELFSSGIKRFIIGVVKKSVISNTLAVMVDEVYIMEAADRTVLLAWMGAICYCLQLYYDFSGYSDMAIGLGRMFGFKFEENFNYPYISRSVNEYWTRWHISLSAWFRDYLYTPLIMVFVRKGWRISICNLCALFLTWLLTGIWHGAAWNYVFYGIYYFVFLYIERLKSDHDKAKRKKLHLKKKKDNMVNIVVSHIYTILVVIFGQMIFRSTGMDSMIKYFKSMFGIGGRLYDSYALSVLEEYLPVMVVAVIFSLPIVGFVTGRMKRKHPVIEIALYSLLFVIGLSFVVSSTYNPFIYFNF